LMSLCQPCQAVLQQRTCVIASLLPTMGMVATVAGFACAKNIGYTLGIGQSFKSAM